MSVSLDAKCLKPEPCEGIFNEQQWQLSNSRHRVLKSMKNILPDELIAHYAEHAQHKLREDSSELEMFEMIIESHRAQSEKIQSLTQELVERFQAVELLALALRQVDAQIFEDTCKQSRYLTMLKERGVLDI